MKAIVITKKGGPEVLELREVPTPAAQDGQVLIRVKNAGVNRSDVYSRMYAAYDEEAGTDIPGLEVSGEITACGRGANRFHQGDLVCALTKGGAYAEYVAVPEGQCLPLPEGWTSEEAATLPETVFTVWDNVFRTGRLKAGENFLVHGGSSGIGVTAIQLATALGAFPYTTAGTEEKCRWCEELGAIRAVNYKTEDFEEILKGIGIDVILDMTGGDFTIKNIRVLREEGRLLFINSMRGGKGTIDIPEIMRKRILVTGSMLKPRSIAYKAELAAEVEKKVWPLLAQGLLRPIIHAVLPLEKAAEAQTLMESSTHRGKILLSVS